MGKRKRVGRLFNRLREMFDLAMQDSFISQTMPDFEGIISFLEQHRNKPQFYAEVLRFYFYLQTFNACNKPAINTELASLAISRESTKVYEKLLETLQSILISNRAVLYYWKNLERTYLDCVEQGNFASLAAQKEAYRRSDDFNKKFALSLFEANTRVAKKENLELADLLVVLREASNAINAKKIKTSIIDPVINSSKNALANSRWVVSRLMHMPAAIVSNAGKIFNKRTVQAGLLLAASDPVAAMTLVQKTNNTKKRREERSVTQPSYLNGIINSESTQWSKYYSYVDEIIQALEGEVVRQGHLSAAIKNEIFLFFKKVNEHKPFTVQQAEKIYKLIENTLEGELFSLEENNLRFLENILTLKSIFPADKGRVIFNLCINAAIKSQSLIYIKDSKKWISQLFSAFEATLPDSINTSSELLTLIEPIQSLINRHLLWNKDDPAAMLVQGLNFLRKIRKKYQANVEISNAIDNYAKEISEKALQLIPTRFFDYPRALLQEDIGGAYVKDLDQSARSLFNRMYKIRTAKNVLPHVERRGVAGREGAPELRVEINYDELLREKKTEALHRIREAYLEVEAIKKRLGLSSVEMGSINIKINVFNNEYDFRRYMRQVWQRNVEGKGGICVSNDETCTSFVYQTEEGIYALKHEVTHALMKHFLGKHYDLYVSNYFVDGIAEWIEQGKYSPSKMAVLRRKFEGGQIILSLSEIVSSNDADRYFWGYFWLKFMLEQETTKEISSIFRTIQEASKGEFSEEVKAKVAELLDQYARNNEDHFRQWLVKLDQEYHPPSPPPSPPPLPIYQQYHQDLQKSKKLVNAIKQNRSLTFSFADGTVFKMDEEKLYLNGREVLQQGDYYWFMKGLARYVIETKLKRLVQHNETFYNEIISKLLGNTRQRIMVIKNSYNVSLIENAEIVSAVEDFVLHTNNNLKQFYAQYPRVANIDARSFEEILKQEIEEHEARKKIKDYEKAVKQRTGVLNEATKNRTKPVSNTLPKKFNSATSSPSSGLVIGNNGITQFPNLVAPASKIEEGSFLSGIIGGSVVVGGLGLALGLALFGYFYYKRKKENTTKTILPLHQKSKQQPPERQPMLLPLTTRSSPQFSANAISSMMSFVEANSNSDEDLPLPPYPVVNMEDDGFSRNVDVNTRLPTPLPPGDDELASSPVHILDRPSYPSYAGSSNMSDSGQGGSSGSTNDNLQEAIFLLRLSAIKTSLRVLKTKLAGFPKELRKLRAFPRMFVEPLDAILDKLDESTSSQDYEAFEKNLESFIAAYDVNKENNASLKAIEHYLDGLSKEDKKFKETCIENFRNELSIQINYIDFLAKNWSRMLSSDFFVPMGEEIRKPDSRILLTKKTMDLARGYFCQLESLTSYVKMVPGLDIDSISSVLQVLKSIFFHSDLENITDKPFPDESSKKQCILCASNFKLAADQLTILNKKIKNEKTLEDFQQVCSEFKDLCDKQNNYFTRDVDIKKAKGQGMEEGIKQGMEEGIKQGREEGIKQGIKQGIDLALAYQKAQANPGPSKEPHNLPINHSSTEETRPKRPYKPPVPPRPNRHGFYTGNNHNFRDLDGSTPSPSFQRRQ